MREDRDNVKAGFFVVAAIVLGMGIIITLSDVGALWQRTRKVSVMFALADGVQGLKEGATVTLGDQPVGKVIKIEDAVEEDRVVGKQVTAVIPERYDIAKNAVIELKPPLLGGGTKLNISSVGMGEPYNYEEDEPIAGGIAPMAAAKQFAREAGIEEAQREQIREIIANVRDATATVKERAPRISEKVEKLVDTVQPMAEDAQAAVAKFRAKSDEWVERVDKITQHTKDLMARADKLMEDKDPAARQAVEDAQAALAKFEQTATDVRSFVTSQRPVIERAIANASLTSDQLKLAAIEIRRSPWRLMYQPTEEELENDNLYDAARSFALAAGAMETTAESVRVLSERYPDDPRMKKMLNYFDQLFKRFRAVEVELWEALGEPVPERNGDASE
ncbi:MAG: hypothetical protein R3336_04710 [Phycisphaeraceae bacterium]|nr:hypothetical protein [Phycisphaeraceae bacterium]